MGKPQALLNRRQRSAYGCSTCKIRKVKCDETKPHCQRCLSTGRVCDGYPSQESQLQRFQSRPSLLLVVPITQQFHTEIDHRAFCTFADFAPTLANFASTEIWNTYALQISYAEPAIRHIVLSVGHLLNTSTADTGSGSATVPDHHHQAVLYHYGKALHALINNPSPDVNVVLLSCLMFCLFEELQGNCYASLQHIIAGKDILLRHLRSSRTAASRSSNLNSIKASSTWDPLLAHLLQLFSRLETHTPVLEGNAVGSHMRLPLSGFPQSDLMTIRPLLHWKSHAQLAGNSDGNPPQTHIINESLPEFDSIAGASQYLASLATACSQDMAGDLLGKAISRWRSTFVVSSRETVLLNHWLEAFNRFMAKLSPNAITSGDLANCHILRTYHGCLTLMNRAKHMGQELVLDDNLVFFDITMFRITILISVAKDELISPLFFVATRCRVAYTRLRAIELLGQCGWEGQFLADVAEHIMNSEESNAKKQASSTDASIPEESRLRLHDIDYVRNPKAGQDDIFHLIVSSFPYYPRAPTMPLPIRLPWARKNFFKARSCLDRALHFEMYPSVP